MEAKLYIAQENFEFRGVKRMKGDTFRITDEKAEGLGEKVRLSDDQSMSPSSPKTPASSPESSPASTPASEASPEAPKDENKETDPASLPQNMSQYKVKEDFELEGVNQEVDSEIELTDEKAAELGEKVEKVEAAPEPEGDDIPAGENKEEETPEGTPAA